MLLSVGILLHGASGIGKSYFLHILESHLSGVKINFVTSPDIFQTNVGQSERKLLKIFQDAATYPRSLLIFEDIDAIAAKSDNALDRSVFGTLLAALNKIPPHVAIIGTTNRMDVIDPALTTNCRLDKVISMAPPTLLERAMMCQHVNVTEEIIKLAAQQTSGFVGADLLSFVREASMATMTDKNPGTITSEHINSALKVVRPSVLQNQKTATMVYTPMFGVEDALNTLEVAIVNPLRDSSAYRNIGIPPPKGVLLTGPSGSGKSHALGYVANQIAPFATCIPVLCTDLISKVVGGTEKALSELFATARQAAPCILLFDQIESLAPVRGFDTSSEQTFDRILSMLLLEMDGFGSSRQSIQSLSHENYLKQHVAIVATTTHAKLLDPAILRPGRFDLEIELTFPDALARSQAISCLQNQTKVAFETEFATEHDFNQWLVSKSEGASVGQLNAVFQEAALACLRTDIHATNVSMTQFKNALVQEISKAKLSNDISTEIDVNME
ncbi:cell division cycle protein 48 [Thraustotheca clavata]|uniref:Cell division cycle protein 48 n=1 Tax=Thraustotheca clavata TaxID=74557 RepID=A0A1W0A7P7_9STRA|nr:cell division cycle protein 48 [Thraustotheca clavata]